MIKSKQPNQRWDNTWHFLHFDRVFEVQPDAGGGIFLHLYSTQPQTLSVTTASHSDGHVVMFLFAGLSQGRLAHSHFGHPQSSF